MQWRCARSVWRAGTLIVAASAVTVTTSGRVSAQADLPPQPFPMLLTPERALALSLAAERKLGYVPGEVLVKFKTGVTPLGQQRALEAVRSRPAASALRWVGDTAVLRDPTESDATILAAQLSSQPEVDYAEPNYLRRGNAVPNDPGYTRQWNLTAIDMPRAWDLNPGGSSNLIVAVVDTGVTTVNQTFAFQSWDGSAIQTITVPFRTSPDLSSARVVAPKDFIFSTGPVVDMVGHGTHVSSTIGEDTNNNVAESGIAYGVKIMPVKVCVGFWEVQFALSAGGVQGQAPLDAGGCPDDAVAQGIQYAADNGAKVINLSLGGEQPSLTLQNALKYAVGKGAFVAIAAGNSFEGGNLIEYPAAYAQDLDGVMAVGAVGPSLARSYFSETGPYVEIAAPGGNDREDNGAGSAFIWQATIYPPDSDQTYVIVPRFDRYAEVGYEGTSMASPHVAGVAALLISQGVTAPAAVEALIKMTARDLGTPGRDNEFGFGLVQPRPALFGFGLAR